MLEIPAHIREFINAALKEDVGCGDVTTSLTVPEGLCSNGRFIAKADFVVAGLTVAREVFTSVDESMDFRIMAEEGAFVNKGGVIAIIRGNTRNILICERVALNILQRMCGVATLTREFVKKIEGLNTKILDTRKTTPGMRFLEKYSVRMGGGENHRFGLYDGILIKDNHIAAAGGVKEALRLVKEARRLMKVEIETSNLDQVREALDAGVDIIMLDNMPVETISEAVKIVAGRAAIEASGNVSLDNVRAIAETGVDFISIGALTHSAPAADISMKLV